MTKQELKECIKRVLKGGASFNFKTSDGFKEVELRRGDLKEV